MSFDAATLVSEESIDRSPALFSICYEDLEFGDYLNCPKEEYDVFVEELLGCQTCYWPAILSNPICSRHVSLLRKWQEQTCDSIRFGVQTRWTY